MPTFLFTAVNRNEKSVTERVEAENLSQAKYKLEIHGYTEINFYESELSQEVTNLFDEKHVKNANKLPKVQINAYYDTRLRQQFITVFKYTFFWWLILACLIYTNHDLSTLIWVIGAILLTLYTMLPGIIYNRLQEAHCWGRNESVRFWGKVAKFFNRIAFVKIPNLEIDVNLACADAREGNLNLALSRVTEKRNDPRVTERLYNLALVRIYGNAKDYHKIRSLYEESLRNDKLLGEELLDYAICLARRHKEPSLARNILEKVFEREQTILTDLFIPYCQGVIEIEDENYQRAEFYLKQAEKRLEPFRNNTFIVGLKSEVKAFLALSLSNRGKADDAERLFAEAKPYLTAAKETELLERCEGILR